MLQCRNYFIVVSTYFYLLERIGFTGYSECEAGGGGEFKLRGCIINGILYGDTTLTGVNQTSTLVPDKFFLSQNYPNPFNPKTIINYQLSIPTDRDKLFNSVRLIVYDVKGKEVAILVNEKQHPGNYSIEFDGTNFPSGIYFYELKTENYSETKRMILLK